MEELQTNHSEENDSVNEEIIKKENISETEQQTEDTWITELKEEEKSWMRELIEFIRDVVIIFVVVMWIRTFIWAPFQISGSSMEASYHDREFIIVDKLSYVIWAPTRWDVVIFRPHAQNGKEFYIKRVVWIPGDSIKFSDWDVFVKKSWNDKYIKLNEDYLSPMNKWRTFLPENVKETEFVVPDKEYFLMWDNRNNSSDSRHCFMSCSIDWSSHYIKQSDVLGKVFLDFGYFNIFQDWTLRIWSLKWVTPPRYLGTPRTWDYTELN